MSWYAKYVLPKLLDSVMSVSDLEKLRPTTVEEAQGAVLEIGGGSGLNFLFYKNVEKLYFLEPSAELVVLAKARSTTLSFPVEFLVAGAEDIPLPDGSVDAVVSTWTLCSIPNVGRALGEIARVLKSGGRFVFIDHGVSPQPTTRFIQNILTPCSKYCTGNCHLTRDILSLISGAGFKVEKGKQFKQAGTILVYNYQGVAVVK